jgi:hypothetical protein
VNEEPWWIVLLRQQQKAQFADLGGSEASLRIPISDRLLTRLILSRLPSSIPIKELDLRASVGNQLAVRLKLTRPVFLPALTIRLVIDQQPVLPASPVLVLRVVSQGMAAMGNTALRFLQGLPAGLQFEGDRLSVNLATLLERYGGEAALEYFTSLEVSTDERHLIISARAAIPPTTNSEFLSRDS